MSMDRAMGYLWLSAACFNSAACASALQHDNWAGAAFCAPFAIMLGWFAYMDLR